MQGKLQLMASVIRHDVIGNSVFINNLLVSVTDALADNDRVNKNAPQVERFGLLSILTVFPFLMFFENIPLG